MDITIKKGLDIPLGAKPKGEVQALPKPKVVALCFDPFAHTRFKVLVKIGDTVKIGQPLAENKAIPGQFFVSPGGGVVKEIVRGLKRRLLAIVVSVAEKEEHFEPTPLKVSSASAEQILEKMLKGGIFPHIQRRPFCLLANPKEKPKAIFVQAIESAPLRPSSEMQVLGNEDFFQLGLEALTKLTDKVHLVYRKGSLCTAFTEATGCEKHAAEGPHPIANPSVHIQKILPIKKPDEVLWTIDTLGVIALGKMMATGEYLTSRVIAIAGDGILKDKRGFYAGRAGHPVGELMEGRITNELVRTISGDPLNGSSASKTDYLGFNHTTFTSLPESTKREAFHFFRLGRKKYTATRTYLSGLIKPPKKGFAFSTNQHGEERPFIDGGIYNKVMPLHIPTMQLLKAVMAEDFELAQLLGLLEVAPEDFALPAFIDPSKTEMMQIIDKGLHLYSQEMGH